MENKPVNDGSNSMFRKLSVVLAICSLLATAGVVFLRMQAGGNGDMSDNMFQVQLWGSIISSVTVIFLPEYTNTRSGAMIAMVISGALIAFGIFLMTIIS